MRSPHPQFSLGSASADGDNITSRMIFALRTGRAPNAHHSTSMF